jgi:hypothetical protein
VLRGVKFLATALVACGSPAAALPVRVALEWPADRPASAVARVHIQAIRTAGPVAGGPPVEAEAGPDGAVLDLGSGVWQVEASAPGYWSDGAEVTVEGRTPASVRVTLWPAASLHGAILTDGAGAVPPDLEVRLSAIPDRARERTAPGAAAEPPPSPSRATLRCRIDGGAWSCPGPAGVFDVRLEIAGYAPRYAWDVSLDPAARTDLGPTELRRGPWVFGRAARSDGSNPQGPCRATLQGNMTRRGSPQPDGESAADGETNVSAPLSRRGYFQVMGVPPGTHLLDIECPSASALHELSVQADGESRVDPPLLLEELTLDVDVTPKVDGNGRPWQLTVEAIAPRWRRIADKVSTSADGRWARRGLTAGSYRVAIQSADGTPWLQRVVALRAGSGPLSLRVGFVEVAGRVRLGEQPLRTRLVFSNESGGEPVTLTSDDDGRFQGLLPAAADVLETRWTVEAHASHPPISRRLEDVRVRSTASEAAVWVDLALPVFAVRGTVVSEDGEPQSGAQVTFEDTRSGARTLAATDEAGRFELSELPPGSYTAVAESTHGISERTELEVMEGLESELHLVLGRSERIAFYVVAGQDPVEDAAVQVWIAPGVPRAFARTDADGRFEAELPPGSTEVGLTVGARGHALKLTRMPVSNEQTVTLGASGGRLVLDLQPPAGSVDSAATPYLVHDGAIEAAGALAGWGGHDAAVSAPTVIEAIEPGIYALCLARPEELADLWRGPLPSNRCRKGSVEPGGTLTLSLP